MKDVVYWFELKMEKGEKYMSYNISNIVRLKISKVLYIAESFTKLLNFDQNSLKIGKGF